MRWAGEVAIPLLCRESHGDAPDHPPPPRLWTVLIHVVHKCLCRIHPDQPHRPRSGVLCQNCDYWDDIVCMPIPNAGINCSIVYSERVLSQTCLLWNRNIQPFLYRQSPETVLLEKVQVQQSESLPTLDDARQSEPWVKPKDLAIICRTSTNDARCVSWILRNITDPEALDTAIRLAGEVRWFDNGTDVDLPYDLVVSTYKACFDSTGKLSNGSRDRTYYSGWAIV